MPHTLRRSTSALLACLLLASATSCRKPRKTTSAPNTTSYSDSIAPLAAANRLDFLRWPDVSDYQPAIKTFYDDRNDEIAWTRDGVPTPAARGFLKAFAAAELKGLRSEDYDSSRWLARLNALAAKKPEAIAEFDVAMTASVMRFISDLRIGRVNPQHFRFDIDVTGKKYDLAEFVSDKAVDSTDIPALLKEAEPDSEPYRRTATALAHYLDLETQQIAQEANPLPPVAKTLTTGAAYSAAPELAQRLALEGDLDADDYAELKDHPPTVFTTQLSEAVKTYQHRHGFTEDGRLTQQTIDSLNVPLSDRVKQLEDTLERWRWLPDPYVNPRLMVNLPEFVLRGYTPDHQLDFTMRVVVGQVLGEHQTPVFAHMMRYIVFRPFWNVPVDIARKELVPHMSAKPGYLEAHNFEVTNAKGQPVSYTTRQVEQGAVLVREKPGPKNSLGLVKFMFPNQYDVYLHSTPAVSLFQRTRRDFSHGCIRVQKPEDLAAWLLDGQNDSASGQKGKAGDPWDLDKVHEAMTDGPDNHQVNLKTPVPIVIFYMTAEAEDDGHTHFFDDIYGYDAALEKVLEKGPPYPVKPTPLSPAKTKTGDTV